MAGLVPAIYVCRLDRRKDVDARDNGPVLGPAKPDPSAGHDGSTESARGMLRLLGRIEKAGPGAQLRVIP
jgi:hypothetical protein